MSYLSSCCQISILSAIDEVEGEEGEGLLTFLPVGGLLHCGLL